MADVGEPEELSHEQKKEEEQAVIQKKIEETEAQIERLEMMDSGMKDMTLQELAVIFLTDDNPMQDNCYLIMFTNEGCWYSYYKCHGVFRHNRTLRTKRSGEIIQLYRRKVESSPR